MGSKGCACSQGLPQPWSEAHFIAAGLSGAPIVLLHVVSDDRPLLFAAIDFRTCGFRRRRRRTVGRRRARGRAGLGVGARRYALPEGPAGLAGWVCCAVSLGGVVPAWFTVLLFRP